MSFWKGPLAAEALASGHNAFGFTRLMLAAAVVLSHSYSVLVGTVEVEPLKQSTGYTLGEHAVNGFFVISGLLVAMSFDRRGLKEYLVARFLRIFPGLAGATLFSALLMGAAVTTLPLAEYFSTGQTWNFIRQVLTDLKSANRLPGVFESNPFPFVMATVWTLKYEVFCYLGLALLGALGVLRQPRLALGFLVAVGVALVAYHLYQPGPHDRGHTALRLVFLFAFGSSVYSLRDRVRLTPTLSLMLVLFTFFAAGTPLFTPLLLLAEAYGCLVFALGSAAHYVPEPSDDISYGIYLYGWPLQQAIQAVYPNLPVATFIVVSFVATIPLAFASWRLIEKPFLSMKKGRPR